jgi:hypothetical protein
VATKNTINWAFAAVAALIVGSLGPWATATILGITTTKAGTSGDWVITLILAVPACLGLLYLREGKTNHAIMTVVSGLLAVAVTIYDIVKYHGWDRRTFSERTYSSRMGSVSCGGIGRGIDRPFVVRDALGGSQGNHRTTIVVLPGHERLRKRTLVSGGLPRKHNERKSCAYSQQRSSHFWRYSWRLAVERMQRITTSLRVRIRSSLLSLHN